MVHTQIILVLSAFEENVVILVTSLVVATQSRKVNWLGGRGGQRDEGRTQGRRH